MESSFHPPFVLLAEDDAEVCRTLTSFFEHAGWRYDVVNDGKSGLNAAENHNYDVIITDYQMPELDGLQFLKSLRAVKPHQAFIVLSSACSPDEVLEFMRQGAADLVQKPVNMGSLERAVKRVVSGVRRRQRELVPFAHVLKQVTVYEFKSSELAEFLPHPAIVERLYQSGRLTEKDRLRLELAFDEALTNSLEHGNLELKSSWKDEIDDTGLDLFTRMRRERLADPEYAGRKIVLRTEYEGSTLTIRIIDSGKGFPAARKRSRKKDKLECHGRGLSIIDTMMDEVRYARGGREIIMKKVFG